RLAGVVTLPFARADGVGAWLAGSRAKRLLHLRPRRRKRRGGLQGRRGLCATAERLGGRVSAPAWSTRLQRGHRPRREDLPCRRLRDDRFPARMRWVGVADG